MGKERADHSWVRDLRGRGGDVGMGDLVGADMRVGDLAGLQWEQLLLPSNLPLGPASQGLQGWDTPRPLCPQAPDYTKAFLNLWLSHPLQTAQYLCSQCILSSMGST